MPHARRADSGSFCSLGSGSLLLARRRWLTHAAGEGVVLLSVLGRRGGAGAFDFVAADFLQAAARAGFGAFSAVEALERVQQLQAAGLVGRGVAPLLALQLPPHSIDEPPDFVLRPAQLREQLIVDLAATELTLQAIEHQVGGLAGVIDIGLLLGVDEAV